MAQIQVYGIGESENAERTNEGSVFTTGQVRRLGKFEVKAERFKKNSKQLELITERRDVERILNRVASTDTGIINLSTELNVLPNDGESNYQIGECYVRVSTMPRMIGEFGGIHYNWESITKLSIVNKDPEKVKDAIKYLDGVFKII